LVCPVDDETGASTTEPSVLAAEAAQVRLANDRVGAVKQLRDDQKRIGGRATYLPVERIRDRGYGASRERRLDEVVDPFHDELGLLSEVVVLLHDSVQSRSRASGPRSTAVQLSANQIRVSFDEVI
jgi:hypothetical protein